MSAPVTKPDGLGLDKAARNKLNRDRDKDAEAEPEAEPVLEPPFPYAMLLFDPLFFDT